MQLLTKRFVRKNLITCIKKIFFKWTFSIDFNERGKNVQFLTHDEQMHDDGRITIALGHLNDLGYLKKKVILKNP